MPLSLSNPRGGSVLVLTEAPPLRPLGNDCGPETGLRHLCPAPHVLRYFYFVCVDNRQILGEMDGIDILLQQLAVSRDKYLYLSEKDVFLFNNTR